MRKDDYFLRWENAGLEDLPGELNRQLLSAIRKGPIEGFAEVEVALELTHLVHGELEAFGTSGGGSISAEEEIALCILALRAVLKRLKIAFELPSRDFTTFRSYWIKEGARGEYQARRDLLGAHFDRLFARLTSLEEASFESLAQPVSPRGATGWPAVDEELTELKRRSNRRSPRRTTRRSGRCASAQSKR